MPEAADLNVDELRRRARRRLIGAIVLALVAATVVPMLLESEPKPLGEEVSVKIPPIDDGKFVNRLTDSSKREPLSAGSAKVESGKDSANADAGPGNQSKKETKETAPRDAAKEVGAAAPAPPAPRKPLVEAEQRVLAPSAKSPAPTGASAANAPAKAGTPAPPTSETSQASEATKSETPKEGFAVQLAAFADDKGANALANKLKRTGYPAYTESLTTSKSTLWRVRVGPYPSRDAAGAARTKLKDDGYNGIVAPAR
ncbi:MAG: SPOR domain-containing protein [Betaproteobacteria bacterium]|nr:SPOR domain-containing protein [Betaproteobacteria bacterium]MBA3775470.1 SPOR domain-containing protein [Betaproteobacteria bacterium]